MTRKALVLLVAVLIGAGLLAPAAGAQYQPGQPGFILTPSTITPGGEITGIGFGCARNQIVEVSINDTVVGTTLSQSDDRGSFQVIFRAPAAPGTYVVTVSCGPVIMSSVLTVVAAPTTPASTLVRSGSDATLPLTRVALVLIAVGGLILLAVRRQANAST